MSAHSDEQVEPMASEPRPATKNESDKPRSVEPCNFRSAGRLSNENARALTTIHETFARQLAGALDAYVGKGVKVKLQTLDQLAIKDHIASLPSFLYIAPFALGANPGTLFVECEIDLVFPIMDLLLGGTGEVVNQGRELSEIEEVIMQDLTSVIARQAESAWAMTPMSLVAKRRVESSGLHQLCPPGEKITRLKFEVEVAGLVGSFLLVFPSSFVNILIKQSKLDKPQKKGELRYFPTSSLRERILDCDVMVAADLPNMRVSVRDLVALQPGYVLKLRAPVRTPGMLTVGGREIFEAVPVRNGTQKAAQVGRRMQMTSWGKG